MGKTLRRSVVLVQAILILVLASSRLKADTGTCSGVSTTVPFTDVMSSIFFCQIAEAYFSGLTNGTSATTYSPSDPVPREQMAAFITRTQDSALRRGSKRAALQQFWTTTPLYLGAFGGLGTTGLASSPILAQSDGKDVWVATAPTVTRVGGSDGKALGTWTGANSAVGVLVAAGRTFVTAGSTPGGLYMIDPATVGGAVTEMTGFGLGSQPVGAAFDGARFWTANLGTTPGTGSVSIISPTMTTPWPSSTVTTGFSNLEGILFDGSNIWVADRGAGTLLKLDPSGGILQTVPVGAQPFLPAFDGTNIWVPNNGASTVSVVRAATGAVIATLTGNGLHFPSQAAFDGQRILVANSNGGLSLWKAADLTPISNFSAGSGTAPFGVCSDGTYFWITLTGTNQLARF